MVASLIFKPVLIFQLRQFYKLHIYKIHRSAAVAMPKMKKTTLMKCRIFRSSILY